MRCQEVREVLPAFSREGDPGLSVRRHLAHCDDCNEELTRYRSLLTALGDLRQETAEPPRGLVHQLAAIPYRTSKADEVRTHVTRNRNKYAAGIAVAALGAAGAAVWKTRRGRLATV